MEKMKNTFQTNIYIYTYLHIKRERKQFTYMQQKRKKSKFSELFINQVHCITFHKLKMGRDSKKVTKGHTICNGKWSINLEF